MFFEFYFLDWPNYHAFVGLWEEQLAISLHTLLVLGIDHLQNKSKGILLLKASENLSSWKGKEPRHMNVCFICG